MEKKNLIIIGVVVIVIVIIIVFAAIFLGEQVFLAGP